VQTNSTFCGQCGYSIQAEIVESEASESASSNLEEAEASSAKIGATIQSLPPQSSSPDLNNPPPTVPTPPTTLDVDSEVVKGATRLQMFTPSLLHVQTNTKLEIPQGLPVIHIGKPNEQIPPDIDVSGFPDSDIVSRIHADIRVEGDMYYLEDNGSSNGTYVNHTPVTSGNRHRLRTGDRISLGKGDKVTFIFQLG
jgi:pSer/pThr/pTyr-binding forkhead associated (FHA) protein